MLIQRLRDNSDGLIAKIIVGLIIVVFALFGFGSITTFLVPVAKVATVNGTDISQQEMEVAVERSRRIQLSQGAAPEEIDEDRLRQNVLQSLVNRALLSQQTEDLGLGFSDQALDLEIVQTPAFQVDGVFNAQQFQLVINSAGFTAVSYRQEMRRDKEFQQLVTAIRGSSFLTEMDAERATNLSRQTRDIAFLRVDTDSLSETINVDETEIQAFYDANAALFVTEEMVDLEYVELSLTDLMEEVQVVESELATFFEETKGIYSTDERRRLAHILIEVSDAVDDTAARTKAEGIYARIKDGEVFDDLAREFSDDPGSAQNGGDLGFNVSGTFVPEFEATAFDLNLNQVSEPTKTEFGYHIIKLLGMEEAKIPELADIRDKVEKDYRQSLAEDEFVTRSKELDEIAFESADLQVPAEELNLEIKRTGLLPRSSQEGIMASSAVALAAFTPDVLLDRNNSPIIAVSPNHNVVVRIGRHQESQVQPFLEVRAQIRETLVTEKATTLAESQAGEMVEMLNSGSITRYVADQYGLEWTVNGAVMRNQPGLDQAILREAFSLPRPLEGTKTIGMTMLPDGDAVVISVTNVKNGTESAADGQLKQLARILGSQQGNADFQEFQESLVARASVSRVN